MHRTCGRYCSLYTKYLSVLTALLRDLEFTSLQLEPNGGIHALSCWQRSLINVKIFGWSQATSFKASSTALHKSFAASKIYERHLVQACLLVSHPCAGFHALADRVEPSTGNSHSRFWNILHIGPDVLAERV
jgi:hypothetical protein